MEWFRFYREIWAVDFEFQARTGERPAPRCMVGRELKSNRLARFWLTDAPADPPFVCCPDVLFVAFYSSAELGCFLALDWPFPLRILDLFSEFRNFTNGLPVPCGNGLLGALAYFGLPALDVAEKESMRALAMRDGPYTEAERLALLDYCQSDVDALARLLPAMGNRLDLPQALLRGRYMAAAARMEWNGTPLDLDALDPLRMNWEGIKRRLIVELDPAGEIFEPAGRRHIDPASTLGAALIETATDWGIDLYHLAAAVEDVWHRHRELTVGRVEAIRSARKATGLTAARASRWEDAGHDYASWPSLDTVARDLAGEWPELGIGRGYDPDAPDVDDHPARLWNLLREPTPALRPRYDPGILREAAEMVVAASPGRDYRGPMRFSAKRFSDFLARHGIPWPQRNDGNLALDDDTFREMARLYPDAVGPIRELRHSLSQLRLTELAVGADGRNRLILSAFQSRTGRNQPSNSRFIFGPSVWLRSLIRPASGRALSYVDWSGQEYGIAAALSGDKAMQTDYRSGDPYLAFGRRIGAVPADATKRTHGPERDRLKVCCGLGAMYGAGPATVAQTLGVPEWQAREWLRSHREAYSTYWRWSDAVVDDAMLTGRLQTVFGWSLHTGQDVNPRSLRNFPMQANGAEMMRLAACLLTERGIAVCAPVHDAFLIEADADTIDQTVEATQRAMQEAAEIVLAGFPLRTDAKIIRHPERYLDGRGRTMWDTVQTLLVETEQTAKRVAECDTHLSHFDARSCRTPLHPSHSFFFQDESIPL